MSNCWTPLERIAILEELEFITFHRDNDATDAEVLSLTNNIQRVPSFCAKWPENVRKHCAQFGIVLRSVEL